MIRSGPARRPLPTPWWHLGPGDLGSLLLLASLGCATPPPAVAPAPTVEQRLAELRDQARAAEQAAAERRQPAALSAYRAVIDAATPLTHQSMTPDEAAQLLGVLDTAHLGAARIQLALAEQPGLTATEQQVYLAAAETELAAVKQERTLLAVLQERVRQLRTEPRAPIPPARPAPLPSPTTAPAPAAPVQAIAAPTSGLARVEHPATPPRTPPGQTPPPAVAPPLSVKPAVAPPPPTKPAVAPPPTKPAVAPPPTKPAAAAPPSSKPAVAAPPTVKPGPPPATPPVKPAVPAPTAPPAATPAPLAAPASQPPEALPPPVDPRAPSASPTPAADPCAAPPGGVVTLKLADRKSGRGGQFKGQLPARGTAGHQLLICSHGDLEVVVSGGFMIEGLGPTTGQKRFATSDGLWLRWGKPGLTPGQTVTFRVRRMEATQNDAYTIEYYLYPR